MLPDRKARRPLQETAGNGPSIPRQSTELVLEGPRTKTVVSDDWRVASKGGPGSWTTNLRLQIGERMLQIENRRSKIENDRIARRPDHHGFPRCVRNKRG